MKDNKQTVDLQIGIEMIDRTNNRQTNSRHETKSRQTNRLRNNRQDKQQIHKWQTKNKQLAHTNGR